MIVQLVIPAEPALVERYHGLHAAAIVEPERRIGVARRAGQAPRSRSRKNLREQSAELWRGERVQNGVDGGVDWHHENNHPNGYLICSTHSLRPSYNDDIAIKDQLPGTGYLSKTRSLST